MRLSLRGLSAFGLCVLLVAPMLIDAGCANHQASALDEAVATLASSGVGVYESSSSRAPMQTVGGTPSAMRLTRSQLATMVAQNDAGMGWSGADMDRVEGNRAPKGAPTISMFVAAWLTRGGTPLSTYAKQLMGTRTYDIKTAPSEVFPLLVVTLFVADIAPLRAGAKVGSASQVEFESWIAAPAMADGICTSIANFAAATLTNVTSAIENAAGSILASIFSYIVKAIKTAIELLLAPFLLVISKVSAAIAAIAAVVSLLSPWTVTVDPDPKSVMYGDKITAGTLTATVTGKTLDVPQDVADCAKQLGDIDLSDISSNGADVTWGPYGKAWSEYANVKSIQGTLGDDRKAKLSYQTQVDTHEQPKAECSSPQFVAWLSAKVEVQRIDAVHAQQKLLEVIVGKTLPKWVNSQLIPFIQPWITPTQVTIANYIKSPAVGYGRAAVYQQQPDPNKCTASPPPSGQLSAAPTSDNAALVGDWSCNTTVTVNNKELGPFSVTVQTAMTFDKNGTSTGTQWGGAAMSGHSIRNGPGTGLSHTGDGKYTYDASGPDGGMLHVDGKNLVLKFSNPNAFTTHVTSPVSNRTYNLNCKRS